MARERDGRIAVAVVHPHELVRKSVCTEVLESADFQLVFTGARLDELHAAIEAGKVKMPQVVLLRIEHPANSVLADIQRWRRRHPGVGLVGIGPLTELMAQRMLEAGLLGVLPESVSCQEVVRTLRTASTGGLHLNSWSRVFFQQGRKGLRATAADRTAALTHREAEVLSWICKPEAPLYATIAAQLNIGVRTVEAHRDKLFEKLEVHSRSALVVRALELGLVKLHG